MVSGTGSFFRRFPSFWRAWGRLWRAPGRFAGAPGRFCSAMQRFLKIHSHNDLRRRFSQNPRFPKMRSLHSSPTGLVAIARRCRKPSSQESGSRCTKRSFFSGASRFCRKFRSPPAAHPRLRERNSRRSTFVPGSSEPRHFWSKCQQPSQYANRKTAIFRPRQRSPALLLSASANPKTNMPTPYANNSLRVCGRVRC